MTLAAKASVNGLPPIPLFSAVLAKKSGLGELRLFGIYPAWSTASTLAVRVEKLCMAHRCLWHPFQPQVTRTLVCQGQGAEGVRVLWAYSKPMHHSGDALRGTIPLMDRAGRRILLLSSCVGMATWALTLFSFYALKPGRTTTAGFYVWCAIFILKKILTCV